MGRPHSEETKRRMSATRTGRKLSDAHKSAIAKANLRENLSAETLEKRSTALLGRVRSAETKKRISESKMGNQNRLGLQHSNETKQRISATKKAQKRKCPQELKAKLSALHTGNKYSLGRTWSIGHKRRLAQQWSKEKNPNWKDGLASVRRDDRHAISGRLDYRLWREAVFKRDNFTCFCCARHGGYLEADHIKSWVAHPELRFDADNGRTVCRPCHVKLPTHGSGALKSA